MKTWLSYNWLKLLALIMALTAVYAGFPFVYYQLTGWVIFGAAFVSAQQAHTHDRTFLFWLFLATAVVFNQFSRLAIEDVVVWQALYFLGALVFFGSLFLLTPKK